MQSKIFSALKELGLRGDFLREMNDHFCSDYEARINNGASAEQAFFLTHNKLQAAGLNKTQRNLFLINHQNKIILTMSTLLLFIFTIFSTSSTSHPSIVEVNEYINEIGADTLVFGKVLAGNPKVTSHFGMRYNPIKKKQSMHKGIDLKGNIGDPVFTPADGIVAEVGFHDKKGFYIEINHANGFTSRYFHLSEIMVVKDAVIKEGIQIGKVGSSGMSLAPHLHFEILKKETPMDPKDFLRV